MIIIIVTKDTRFLVITPNARGIRKNRVYQYYKRCIIRYLDINQTRAFICANRIVGIFIDKPYTLRSLRYQNISINNAVT